MWWGGRAAMRSPAENRLRAVSEYIGVRIPSPPLTSRLDNKYSKRAF